MSSTFEQYNNQKLLWFEEHIAFFMFYPEYIRFFYLFQNSSSKSNVNGDTKNFRDGWMDECIAAGEVRGERETKMVNEKNNNNNN